MRRSLCLTSTSRLFVILSVATFVVLGASSVGQAAEKGFPYEQELMLDARPMKGAKRVPMMEVMRRGDTKIELWCDTVRAQFVVVDDTITIITGAKSAQQCAPERIRGDDDLLAALLGVTNWRRDGDVLMLRGPKTLRFRASTH